MDFQHFLEYVPYLAEAKLPAMAAHIKMVPFERTSLKNTFDEYKTKNGCCYDVILSKEWDDTFGFNCRNSMKVHSGRSLENGKRKMRIFCDSFAKPMSRNPSG
jgi:hypothetical protein